jgi:hypothetical protein
MSRAKALPNRRLRQNQENRPLGLVWPNLLSEFPLKKLGWPEIASNQPGVAIQIKLTRVIIGIVMAVVTMPAVPIVRTIIRSCVIPVRIIGTVRVVSVITRTEPDTEVNSSVRTRRPREHQTPGHDCNRQKFLHDSSPSNLTGELDNSFLVIRRR